MLSMKRTICSLLVAFGVVASASAETIIADFANDYVAGTAGQTRAQAKADGWNYLWNANGAIGTAANYTSLVYNTSANFYCSRADSYGDDGTVGGYVKVENGCVHPGRGVSNPGFDNAYERFAIAAYTIQASQAGNVSITDSSLTLQDASGSTGVELRIYVNDILKSNITVTTGSVTTFNESLGMLKSGDTVYVCLGPNGVDWCDNTLLSYKLAVTPVPEPHALVLSAVGLFALLAYGWRKRK